MAEKSVEELLKEGAKLVKEKSEKLKDYYIQEKYFNCETNNIVTSKKKKTAESQSKINLTEQSQSANSGENDLDDANFENFKLENRNSVEILTDLVKNLNPSQNKNNANNNEDNNKIIFGNENDNKNLFFAEDPKEQNILENYLMKKKEIENKKINSISYKNKSPEKIQKNNNNKNNIRNYNKSNKKNNNNNNKNSNNNYNKTSRNKSYQKNKIIISHSQNKINHIHKTNPLNDKLIHKDIRKNKEDIKINHKTKTLNDKLIHRGFSKNNEGIKIYKKHNTYYNNKYAENTERINIFNRQLNFFQKKIIPQKKYNGKSDSVNLYHLFNKDWVKYPLLTKMKKEKNI